MNFGYIIQRLLSIFTEERAFWIFVAIMSKMKDRIGVDDSIMLDRKGMFRLISTCLCSHTKETLPEVFDKFTEIGLSMDFFLYDKMSCLFANCFPSDTLLRLWDLIFLEFSSPAHGGKSKGLGYIVSTCLYLLNVNKEQILMTTTPYQLSIALDNSCSTKFNTEEIIEDIFNKNTHNFVAGNWFARKLASISKVFGDAASYLDNARISLEEDYDLIFEKVMRENKAVWSLVNPYDNMGELTYPDWHDETNSCIIAKFKNCFGKTPSERYSPPAKQGMRGGDLGFVTIYIFIYNCFDIQNIGKPAIGKCSFIKLPYTLDLTCMYGGNPKGSCPISKYERMTPVGKSLRLKYIAKENEVAFVVKEKSKIFGSCVLDLNNFKPDKVYKFWVDVISEDDNDNDLEFEIGVLCENSDEHGQRSSFVDSIKKKLPDRVDILNEVYESDFIKRTKGDLINQLDYEKRLYEEYFDEYEARLMLNDKYNFFLTKDNLDMGRIYLEDLKEFNAQVLYSRWENQMEDIYDEFTTTTKQALENKSGDVNNILDKAAMLLLCKTLARRNYQLYGMENQDSDFGFSLRNFVVVLVLMSSITVGQKLDLLYEIFDWDDGEGDGLDLTALKLMANTILNRNLQFVPSNQVNNMMELLYDGTSSCITSCIYQPYRPRKDQTLAFDFAVKGLRFKYNKHGQFTDDDDDHLEPIDLTMPFQEILWKYHRFFGCKSMLFHPKESPFKDLQQVLKTTKYDILLPKNSKVENVLCIVYVSNGVKRVFTAYYNGYNKLIGVGDDPDDAHMDLQGVEKILHENKYFCNIENTPKTIPKTKFIFKALHVPYLSDFMRTETSTRVINLESLMEDQSKALDNPLMVHILDKSGIPMITCEFSKDTDMNYDPGLTHKLIDNDRIRDYVVQGRHTLTIKMSATYKSSTFNDIIERVRMGVKTVQAEVR